MGPSAQKFNHLIQRSSPTNLGLMPGIKPKVTTRYLSTRPYWGLKSLGQTMGMKNLGALQSVMAIVSIQISYFSRQHCLNSRHLEERHFWLLPIEKAIQYPRYNIRLLFSWGLLSLQLELDWYDLLRSAFRHRLIGSSRWMFHLRPVQGQQIPVWRVHLRWIRLPWPLQTRARLPFLHFFPRAQLLPAAL